jgi:hypothetical protein
MHGVCGLPVASALRQSCHGRGVTCSPSLMQPWHRHTAAQLAAWPDAHSRQPLGGQGARAARSTGASLLQLLLLSWSSWNAEHLRCGACKHLQPGGTTCTQCAVHSHDLQLLHAWLQKPSAAVTGATKDGGTDAPAAASHLPATCRQQPRYCKGAGSVGPRLGECAKESLSWQRTPPPHGRAHHREGICRSGGRESGACL